MNIPSVDFKRQYVQFGDELERSVIETLRSGNYILGDKVAKLESEVAAISGCSYGIGVANGTDALTLAVWALDITEGDEVIIPSFTFAATAVAVILRGAKPVFVDVLPETFNIDPVSIEKAITPKTKVIMPVHLYGQPVDMQAIMKIAKKFNLKIIEDSAQAIGALYKKSPVGSFGNLSCISFYPTKNLSAAGDAGMIVTNDDVLNERLRALRVYGMKKRYYHEELGINSRLDEIQATIMLSKINMLTSWNEKRRQIANWYTEALQDCENIITPQVIPEVVPVWHQYTIRIAGAAKDKGTSRDTVKEKLAEVGVGSMIYYPIPLHMQKAFAHLGYKIGDLPVSEQLGHEVLSLPNYPELTHEEIMYVVKALKDITNKSSKSISSISPFEAAISQPVS